MKIQVATMNGALRFSTNTSGSIIIITHQKSKIHMLKMMIVILVGIKVILKMIIMKFATKKTDLHIV